MIRKFALALVLATAVFSPAAADIQPPIPTTVPTTATTTIQAGTFYGVLSWVTQLTVVTCYNSATLAGQIIYQNTPTLTTALGIPPTGVALTSGFVTCSIATSIVAPGYTILAR